MMRATETLPHDNHHQIAQKQLKLLSDSLSVSLNELSFTAAFTYMAPPSSDFPQPLSVTPPKSGWHRLPPECLDVIFRVFEHDTHTLGILVQVCRQWFFHVVPRLYRDPFQRIRDSIRHKSCSIRISPSGGGRPPPSSILPSLGGITDTSLAPAAIKSDERIARFTENMELVKGVLGSSECREYELLRTLLFTLVQDLVTRFPMLKSAFYDLYSGFDHRPQMVTWTSQCYLRHWVVIDLEKLYTRRGASSWCKPVPLQPTTGISGVFARRFALATGRRTLGALDYLQRAILNRPGADRIQTLRIPASRLRTYQLKHERAPRPWKKSSKSGEIQQLMEEGQQYQGTVAAADGVVHRGGSFSSGAAASTRLGDNISRRPYCFTWNKLTNLRRLEVFNMTANRCDWETLERVLGTIQCGNYQARPDEHKANALGSQTLDTIQEFSLETETNLDDSFNRILGYFKHLEVLEVQCQSWWNESWLLNWEPRRCESLKVLRMGSVHWASSSTMTRDFFGRFRNLEELRIRLTSKDQFQWIIDAKREARLDLRSHEARVLGERVRTVEGRWSHPLASCLPKLTILALTVSFLDELPSMLSAFEAFGDQLVEVVLNLCFSGPVLRFEHPLPRLRQLALRGDGILTFDFASLAQQCPALELLALQHTYYRRDSVTVYYQALVDALIRLPNLRCLYLEGEWLLDDALFLDLVTGCQSLYKIAIHECPSLSLATLEVSDTILISRRAKRPIPAAGVYRLPKTDFFAMDYLWQRTFFGHDDD